VNAFRRLSPHTREMIVKIGLVTLVAIPLLGVVRRLGSSVMGLGRAFGLSSRASSAWGVALGLAAVAAYKVKQAMDLDDAAGKTWAKTVIDGTATLADYRAEVAKNVGTGSLLGRMLGSDAILNQGLAHAVDNVNRAYHNQVASVLDANGAYEKYNAQLRNSGPMTIKQKANLAALLVTQDRYGVTLSAASEFTFQAFLKTGDYASALKLLRRSLADTLGPLKNVLTYTEKQGEAAADAAQKNRRYVFWLKQIGLPGGGAGGGGGGGPVVGQQRQHGGPVAAMRPYIVGERGPELFIPRVSGTVVPNGAGGTGDTVIPIYLGDELLERVVVKGLNRAAARA
jgi:hypothetical protein